MALNRRRGPALEEQAEETDDLQDLAGAGGGGSPGETDVAGSIDTGSDSSAAEAAQEAISNLGGAARRHASQFSSTTEDTAAIRVQTDESGNATTVPDTMDDGGVGRGIETFREQLAGLFSQLARIGQGGQQGPSRGLVYAGVAIGALALFGVFN